MPQGCEVSTDKTSIDKVPLDQPLPCTACGYDLRGQPTAGVCPECAYAVAVSIEHDRLKRQRNATLDGAPQWWLAAMQTGAVVAIVATVLHLAAAAALPQVAVLYQRRSPASEFALGLHGAI